ncbi:SAM-dependent methyltransferase, partial [Rhizobiaceae sp. 2RAB30]
MAHAADNMFHIRFDENNQEFSIIGSMRPERAEDLDGCARLFEQSLRSVSGTLYVNVKRLVRLNNIAFRVLADLM